MALHGSPLELLKPNPVPAIAAPVEEVVSNVDKARQRVQADRRKLRTNLDVFFDTFQGANQQRSDIEALTKVQVDGALTRGEEAFSNLQKSSRLPDFVTGFLGLIDKTYDEDFQRARLESSYFELSSADIRLQQAERQRKAVLSSAKVGVETAAQFYGLSQEGLMDKENALRFGFEIQGEVRKDLLDFVTDQPDATIKKWMQNPASMPPKLQGKDGLVLLENFRRTAKALNVKSLERSNALQAFNIRREQADQYMDQFTTIAQLLNAARDPDNLPPFVDPNDLLDEAARRTEVTQKLKAADMSNKANERVLFNLFRIDALDSMRTSEIEDLLSRAGKAGGAVTIGNVKYQSFQISTYLTDRRKIKDREKTAIILQNLQITTSIAQDESEIADLAQDHTSINDGITPRRVKSLFANYRNIREDLQFIIDNPNANRDDQLEAQKQLKQAATETLVGLNAYTKEVGDTQYTDMSRPAYFEFMENDGNVRNSTNAMALYIDGVGEFNLDGDPMLSAVNRVLAAAIVDDLNTEVLGFGTGPGNTILLPKDATDHAMSLINQAVLVSGAREVAIRSQYKELLIQAIADITRQADAPPPGQLSGVGAAKARVSALFQDVINIETMQLSQRYTGTNEETGKEEFNSGLLLSDLANINIEAQEMGIIGADASLYEMIFRRQIQLVPSVLNHYRANPTAASLKTIMFGGNDQSALAGIYDNIRIALGTMPKLVAMERRRRKDEAARLVAMAEMSETRSKTFESLFSTQKPPGMEPRSHVHTFGVE